MSSERPADKRVEIPPELGEKLINGEMTLGEFVGLSESAQYAIANLAFQSLDAGRPEKALPLYEGLVAASPNDSVFHCHLAATHYALNNLDKAFEHYDSAIRLNKANADALAGRGELYLQRQEVLKAAADFKAALEADPQGLRLSTLRARTALSMLTQAAAQPAQAAGAPQKAAPPQKK